MQSIVVVGNDENLLLTRAAVLRSIGAEISSAAPYEAIELIKAKRFQAVVLRHTLSVAEATDITKAARESSDLIHVIQIAPLGTPVHVFDGAPVDVVVEPHPKQLVDSIVALLNIVETHAL